MKKLLNVSTITFNMSDMSCVFLCVFFFPSPFVDGLEARTLLAIAALRMERLISNRGRHRYRIRVLKRVGIPTVLPSKPSREEPSSSKLLSIQ